MLTGISRWKCSYRPPLRLLLAWMLLAGLGSVAFVGPAGASSYAYIGVLGGSWVSLTHATNVSVENLPDATLVTSLQDFLSDDPADTCLNFASLNVWTAPKEFPGDFVVHNGDQGSQCAYGTWTIPESPSYYTVTLSAWIPQGTLDGAPLLPWGDYAVIGDSCWTPPWYEAAFADEYIVGNGDGHTGYSGSDRASVTVQVGWNGSSITSFGNASNYVTTSTATAYYYVGPVEVDSCTLSKAGTQLSATPVQTSATTFTLEVKAQNNMAPPELNPALDGSVEVGISGGSPIHATFSLSGNVEDFPSYGVSVSGPLATATDTLSDASGYGNPITYEEVYALLTCHSYSGCQNVSGRVNV